MKRRNEVTVGILVTVAVVVLVLGTLWLARGGLKSGYPLYTRFVWGQNLKQGQPVLLAGISVGYVGDVKLRRDGYLDVVLRIDNEYSVPKRSFATVKPVGIFGDVAVALTPPTPPPQQSYSPGDTVPAGVPTPDIAEILDRVDSIGQSTERLAHALEVQVVQAGTLQDLQKTIRSAAALSAQLQVVMAEQNKNLTETMAAFRSSAEKLGTAVDSSKVNAVLASLRNSSDNIGAFARNLDSTNAKLASIFARIDRGEGSLGALERDSTLYTSARNLLKTADSLMADFKKNPGKYISLHVF